MEPEWMTAAMGRKKDVSYSFDQTNGLQIHAPDTMEKEEKDFLKNKDYMFTEPDPLYDEEADDEDEKWMEKKRMKIKLGTGFETSCNLVCPCCFNCLSCENRLVGRIQDNVWELLSGPTEELNILNNTLSTCPVSTSLKPQRSVQMSESEMKADLRSLRWWSPEDEVDAPPPTLFTLDDDPVTRNRSSGRRNNNNNNIKSYSTIQCAVCHIDIGFLEKESDRYYISGALPSEV